MTNMRDYKEKEILDRVKSVGGQITPNKLLLVGIQSTLDTTNLFDDMFYVFYNGELKGSTTGTTNPGLTVLEHFEKYNAKGAAVWKTDMFYKDLYQRGYHNGSKGKKMKALRQIAPIYHYRDNDKDGKCEEKGELHLGIIGCNQHGVSYNPFSKKIATKIDTWSAGCQVMNIMEHYRYWIDEAWKLNKKVDYCLLKEW